MSTIIFFTPSSSFSIALLCASDTCAFSLARLLAGWLLTTSVPQGETARWFEHNLESPCPATHLHHLPLPIRRPVPVTNLVSISPLFTLNFTESFSIKSSNQSILNSSCDWTPSLGSPPVTSNQLWFRLLVYGSYEFHYRGFWDLLPRFSWVGQLYRDPPVVYTAAITNSARKTFLLATRTPSTSKYNIQHFSSNSRDGGLFSRWQWCFWLRFIYHSVN